MAIVVPRPNASSVVVPSISLTAADGDWPTMDFDTFNAMGGREIRQSRDIRIVLCIEKDSKRRHRGRRGKRCQKCCDAAWANAYFAEAMKKDEAVEVKGNGQETAQKRRVDFQGSREMGSTEDCKAKAKEDREIDSEKRQKR